MRDTYRQKLAADLRQIDRHIKQYRTHLDAIHKFHDRNAASLGGHFIHKKLDPCSLRARVTMYEELLRDRIAKRGAVLLMIDLQKYAEKLEREDKLALKKQQRPLPGNRAGPGQPKAFGPSPHGANSSGPGNAGGAGGAAH